MPTSSNNYSEDEDFLDRIAAEPDNDLPRLVYADWLQENDRDRQAEFIRLQIEIAKLEVGPRAVIDANVPLWRRQQELLDQHFDELLPPGIAELGIREDRLRFRRGFLDEIEVEQHRFVPHAATFIRLRPLPAKLQIKSENHAFAEFIGLPAEALGMITEVQFDRDSEDEEPLALPLFATKVWPRLNRLQISNCSDQPAQATFAEGLASACPKLTHLYWNGCQLTDEVVFALLNSGLLHQLIVVNLRHNLIEDQAAFELSDRLARSKILKNLTLSNNALSSVGQSALLAAFGSRVDLF